MTLTVRPLGAALRTVLLLLGLVALAESANATCGTPAGDAGDMTYSTSANVMAYCDGTNWVSMAGGVSLTVNTSGGGTATPAGSANDVQFNNGANLAADTGNFTYSSGLLTTPNLSTGNVSATTVNATGLGTLGSLLVAGGATVTGQASLTVISTSLIQVGSNGASCTSGLAGGVRYNSTSNTIDYCSGSAWLSLGPSATVVPSFNAYKSGDQSVTSGVSTKITFNNKRFDTNNNYDTSTSRFTPTIPGKYIVTASAWCWSSDNACQVQIYKNGSIYSGATVPGTGDLVPNATQIIDMNGVSDYLEIYVDDMDSSTPTVKGSATWTQFSASLLTMNGGGGGSGTANPAGSTNDVQFNSGGLLAADTGNFTYTTDTGTLSATTISTTVVNIAASASTIANVVGGSGNMISSGSAVVSTSSAGSITFFTGGSQRMIVDSSGKVGINANPVSSPNGMLQVSGSIYSVGTVSGTWSGVIGIAQGSHINYMQMNSTGDTYFASNLTNTNTQFGVGNVGVSQATMDLNSGPPNPGVILFKNGVVHIGNSAGASGWGFLNFYRSGAFIGNVSQNGTTAILFNTTSDRRVKEKITDTREGLQKLMELPVRDFAFKADPSHTIVTGFIAQELNKVFPEAVTTNGDNGETPLKDKSKPWSVDYGRVTPLIVKAVQDLNLRTEGEIKALKADNDNLHAQLNAAVSLRSEVDVLRQEIQELKKANAK